MRSKIAQSTHNPTPPMNIICSSCGKSYVPFSLNSNLSHAEQTTIWGDNFIPDGTILCFHFVPSGTIQLFMIIENHVVFLGHTISGIQHDEVQGHTFQEQSDNFDGSIPYTSNPAAY